MAACTVIYETADGERAFVTYEARTSAGKRFRNTEVHTVRDGKLAATEVYFGWDVPHKAPSGGFLEQAKPA
jgi:ketosteroid isomerase-like protein